ncbi:MAG: DUF554 domain-containing protein [archaeon]
MIGTIVNVAAIIAGSLIGIIFNKIIPDRIKQIVFQALGLSTIILGIMLGIKTQNPLILIFSLVIGGIIGEMFDIEKKLEELGSFVKKKVKSKEAKFVEGFVTSSLVFCVGALAIVGSIEDGINNDQTLLYTKSMLDGFASIAFSSAMGIGVIFSAIPILLYQGGITLLSKVAENYLSEAAITEMSAAGGLLIIGIGINILEIKKIKVSNMLPAILVALLLSRVHVIKVG